LCVGNMPVEKSFLIIGVFFMIIWLVVVPPFQAPDESAHFARAYMIAQGQIVPENNPQGDLGAELPTDIIDFYHSTSNIPFHDSVKYDITVMKPFFVRTVDSSAQVFCGFPNTAIYSPVLYIIQAVGIFLGRSLHLPIIFIYYLACLFNAAMYLFIGYWSLRLIPVLKLPLAVLLLLPICIFEAVSVNADPMIIASAVFFTAYILKLALDDDIQYISKKQMAIAVVLSMVVSNAKVVYAPLFLLYLLIPGYKYKSKIKVLLAFFLFNLAIVLLWSSALKNLSVPLSVVPQQQVMSIIAAPGYFLHRLITSMFSLWNIHSVFNLGWLDLWLPKSTMYGYLFLWILPVLLKDYYEYMPAKRIKGVIVFIFFLAIYVGIHLALYVSWVQPYTDCINGLQGRYFIPISMLLVLAVSLIRSGLYKSLSVTKYYMKNIYFWGISIMLLQATYKVVERYYLVGNTLLHHIKWYVGIIFIIYIGIMLYCHYRKYNFDKNNKIN